MKFSTPPLVAVADEEKHPHLDGKKSFFSIPGMMRISMKRDEVHVELILNMLFLIWIWQICTSSKFWIKNMRTYTDTTCGMDTYSWGLAENMVNIFLCFKTSSIRSESNGNWIYLRIISHPCRGVRGGETRDGRHHGSSAASHHPRQPARGYEVEIRKLYLNRSSFIILNSTSKIGTVFPFHF